MIKKGLGFITVMLTFLTGSFSVESNKNTRISDEIHANLHMLHTLQPFLKHGVSLVAECSLNVREIVSSILDRVLPTGAEFITLVIKKLSD